MPTKGNRSPAVTRRTRRTSASTTHSSTADPEESPNARTNEGVNEKSSSYEGSGTRQLSARSADALAPGDCTATTDTTQPVGDPTAGPNGKIVHTKNTQVSFSSHRVDSFENQKVNDDTSVANDGTETTGDGSSPGSGRLTRNKRKAQDKAEELVVDTTSEQILPQELHIVKRGIQIRVKIILGDVPYSPSEDSSSTVASMKLLGNDGNQYYCQVCRGFGDVVCCDGCPKVFHQNCVPVGTKSRDVLDRDQEPWLCPICTGEMDLLYARKERSKSPRPPTRCADCQKLRHGFDLLPCTDCGNLVHSPPCISFKDVGVANKTPLCQKCRGLAGGVVEEWEENSEQNEISYHGAESSAPINNRKKKRTHFETSTEEKRKKKKKKKKRRLSSASLSTEVTSTNNVRTAEASEEATEDEDIPRPVPSQSAFLFFIADSRWKVEKALTKGHRTFNRLPKGKERNAIVVQEAFQWWNELADDEKRPYVQMAIKDFEQKLLAWKGENESVENELRETRVRQEETKRSAQKHLQIEQYNRLYQKTSVGSRPFKPEPDESNNRVLLDLLYDTRFHPLPLFDSTRNDGDFIQDREANMNKASIPFFDVHGPISSSVGDECMGCSRGWNHQCPVVKHRLPFIEYRARLQAPVSALAASRIGLGLRFASSTNGISNNATLFRWRNSNVGHQLEELKQYRGYSLSNPSERTDEIVRFIEEAAIMKAPEPNPPHEDESTELNSFGGDRQSSSMKHQKCGRCRAVIFNNTGCVQCRRASLVIEKSKSPLANGTEESDRLKVQTAMLRRIQAKDEKINLQRFDERVSEAIIRTKWCPSSILPDKPVLTSEPSIMEDCTTLSGSETEADGDLNEENSSCGGEATCSTLDEKQIPSETMKAEKSQSIESTEANTCADPDGILFRKRTRSRPHEPVKASKLLSPLEEMIAKYKRESREVNKEAIQTACCCLFSALLRRDPLHLFARPVQSEEYVKFIKNPINFGLIRQNLLSGKYTSLDSFCSDCRLLCENALAFNPPASVYFKTAADMHRLLADMQKRARQWIGAIKNAFEGFILRLSSKGKSLDNSEFNDMEHPLDELRATWPEAARLFDQSSSYRTKVKSDFMRTRENELAYYGTLAVQRASIAAEVSMAQYPESSGKFACVPYRDHHDDEALRQMIDECVSKIKHAELRNVSTWREESLVRLVRKVQTARLDRKTVSENGCSRCDLVDKAKLQPRFVKPVRAKKKEIDDNRTHPTRKALTTGLGSEKQTSIAKEGSYETQEDAMPSVISTNLAVRGSKTHGMGLYAEQTFKAGDVVAEYVGEYVVSHIADEREKLYRKERIQDYQFRLNDQLVIDATKKGGPARYINHSCSPNCKAKIVEGTEMKELKRVLIIAQKDININEEISYDYQFPLELDLSARVPCNCGSESCRGFMNWDLPEKGSNCRVLLVHKRGANMRDRIRRLGRPLKKDE